MRPFDFLPEYDPDARTSYRQQWRERIYQFWLDRKPSKETAQRLIKWRPRGFRWRF